MRFRPASGIYYRSGKEIEMKKRIALIALAVLMVLMLAACKSENAKMVDEKIFQLGKITLKSESKIEELEIMVENLTEKEKGQLDNLHILEKARETYEALLEEQNLKYIGKVEDAIKAIGNVTLDSGEIIAKARKAYEDLAEDLQPRVSNYQDLTDAEQAFFDAQVADVETAIAAIGTVTLDSGDAIANAFAVSQKYGEDILSAVKNYDDLNTAAVTYVQLRVQTVVDAIDAIGTVTLESEQKIKDAQNAYAKLSADEKAMVTNYQKLTDANKQYRDMKTAAEKQAKLDLAKSLFRVKRIYAGGHDSVGGVYIYFDFVNLSDKPIKYVHFSFSFYNSVGDRVWDEFSQSTSCYYTGPVYKGQGTESGWRWGKYYNWDIARVELDSLWLEYMDGTSVSFNDDQIAYITY